MATIWGFNASSVKVFRWAKQRGLRCILDQTIGHPTDMNNVMLAERERHPEFFLGSYRPFTKDWIDQQDEELELADDVVVGSRWCAGSLIANGCAEEKIRIVHYGFDEAQYPQVPPQKPDPDGRPIRFIFVGSGGTRKGLPYLLKAFECLPKDQAVLTVIGNLGMPDSVVAQYADRVTFLPQLPAHRDVSAFDAGRLFRAAEPF